MPEKYDYDAIIIGAGVGGKVPLRLVINLNIFALL